MVFSSRKIILVSFVGLLFIGSGVFIFFRLNILGWGQEDLKLEEEMPSEIPAVLQKDILSDEAKEETDAQKELTASREEEKTEQPAGEAKEPAPAATPAVSSDPSAPPLFNIFKTATITPDFFLDGEGSNIESPEFFEAGDYRQSLLLVSGKSNDTIEIWQYPFRGNQQSAFETKSLPNGLEIDQTEDWLLVGFPDEEKITVYKLPGLVKIMSIGEGKFDSGETNMDILTKPSGEKIVYATEKNLVRGFNLKSGQAVLTFSPQVESIEEILADDYHQALYIPEEEGIKSKIHSGGAVLAYHPDGRPYPDGNNILGQGLFSGDEEGITLYKCLNQKGEDTGHGLIIVADQGGAGKNGLEFFNRETWKYLGTLTLAGVSMTDGIASTQQSFPEYPLGLLAVSNNDTNTALIGWEKIFTETGIACD